MLTMSHDAVDPERVCDELMNGGGAVKITGLFSPEQIAEARRVIMEESDRDVAKVTHFQGQAAKDGTVSLQRRVWNLLAKGRVFSEMAAHPVLMRVLRRWLGSEFIMGSIAANRLLPGGPGQEPHVDYPYWDFHQPETHPMGLKRDVSDERAGDDHSRSVLRGERRHRLYAGHAEALALSDAG